MKRVRLVCVLLMAMISSQYGCKKTPMVKAVVGNYKMHGATYFTYLAWNAADSTEVDSTLIMATYADTVITISAYDDSLVNIGGVICNYQSSSPPSYYSYNSISNTFPFVTFTFYRNNSDSATLNILLNGTMESSTYLYLSGKKI